MLDDSNTERFEMIYFTKKKCPKCGGNIYVDENYYREGGLFGLYEQESCLQCGFIIYNIEPIPRKPRRVVSNRIDGKVLARKELLLV